MAKYKFLPSLTRRVSSLKLSNGKSNAITTGCTASNEANIDKAREETLIDNLSKFPDGKSESDRELSFSFLVSIDLTDRATAIQDGGDTSEEQRIEATVMKEKKKKKSIRRSSADGVLLHLYLPVSFTSNSPPRSCHGSPGTTLEELRKREMEFGKMGCWPIMLGKL